MKTARQAGLTPERATRMFLAVLAAALLVVVLFSAERDPSRASAPSADETELVTENIRASQAEANANGGNSGNAPGQASRPADPPPSPPPGQPDGPGNACNTPANQHNPHCRPPSPG